MLLTGFVLIAALSGCNFAGEPNTDSPRQAGSEARHEELKTNINAQDAKDLARPVQAGDGFSVNPVTIGTNSTQNGMQPALGLNTKRLFSEKLGNDDARFDRLERAVQDMRDQLDTLAPSINRLMSVEQDIQELVGQLNTLVQNNGGAGTSEEISANQLENDPNAINRAMGATGAADGTGAPAQALAEGAEQNGTGETPQPPLPTTPAANSQPLQIAPPPPPMAPDAMAGRAPPPPVQTAAAAPMASRTETPQSPPPAAMPMRPPDKGPPPLPKEARMEANGQPRLTNIRMADNAGKTRIVMEASGLMAYSADLDNSENILTLVFSAGSSVDPSTLALHSRLVKSVTLTPQAGGGFVLAVTLNHGSKILGQGKIAPNGDNHNYRLFIDLAD